MSVDHWDQDTEKSWSDKHIIHVVDWLMNSEQSPWKNAWTMMWTACDLPKTMFSNLKSSVKRGALYLRASTRVRITNALKKIINGEIVPRIEQRNKIGWITKFSLLPDLDPKPLPVPPFVKATINITRDGLKITFGNAPILAKPRESKDKLLNPFGV
jgi:hypothetical protein